MTTLPIVISLILCILAAGCALWFWRRSQELTRMVRQLLDDKQQLSTDIKLLTDKSRKRREEREEREKQLMDWQGKYQQLLSESSNLSAKVKEIVALRERELQRAENEQEHLNQQVQALTTQLREFDNEKRELKEQLRTLEGKRQVEVNARLDQFRQDIRNLQQEKRQLEEQQKRAAKELEEAKQGAANSEEMENLKRKNAQYQHFYKTIRSQKEMVEERNQNWEYALKMLSQWILRQQQPQLTEPEGLGALVSTALELTHSGPLAPAAEFPEVKEEPTIQ